MMPAAVSSSAYGAVSGSGARGVISDSTTPRGRNVDPFARLWDPPSGPAATRKPACRGLPCGRCRRLMRMERGRDATASQSGGSDVCLAGDPVPVLDDAGVGTRRTVAGLGAVVDRAEDLRTVRGQVLDGRDGI